MFEKNIYNLIFITGMASQAVTHWICLAYEINRYRNSPVTYWSLGILVPRKSCAKIVFGKKNYPVVISAFLPRENSANDTANDTMTSGA